MQILPNVYLVNGFAYGQHQNGYLLKLGDNLMMVDSGDLENETFEQVQRNCHIWGFDVAMVSHLLVTHAHYDHSSHAARLQRLGTRIVANAACAEAMAVGDERCVGWAVHRTYEPCRVDQIVSDGDVIEIGGVLIRCIAAPGHAQTCMIYEVSLDGRRLWFVGDVVLVGQDCLSAEPGWNGDPEYDRVTYLETLRRLCQTGCDVLLPGHGPACIGQGTKMVEMAYTLAMTTWR